MIRAIIVDDEPHCLDRLSRLLVEQCAATVQLVGSAQTVAAGIQLIRQTQPDLVFLDIQLHDQTGFELLKALNPVEGSVLGFAVIFTTAFDQYALQAFRFSALDYLLKPIDADDLRRAVAKLNRLSTGSDLAAQLNVLFHNLSAMQNTARRIAIPVTTGLRFLPVHEIVRCQSDGNYTLIYLNDGQKHLVAKTLKEFDELLTDANFFRVHHAHLINLAYVKSYAKGKGGSVLMLDDSEIEVSTRRKDDFLKRVQAGRFI